MEKLLLTVNEAAFKLNCSAGYIYKLIYSKELLATKRGNRYLIHNETVKAYADLVTKHDSSNKL